MTQIIVEKEVYSRFQYLVRAYRTENDQIVAFLGKYIVPCNMSEEEILKLFTK